MARFSPAGFPARLWAPGENGRIGLHSQDLLGWGVTQIREISRTAGGEGSAAGRTVSRLLPWPSRTRRARLGDRAVACNS